MRGQCFDRASDGVCPMNDLTELAGLDAGETQIPVSDGHLPA